MLAGGIKSNILLKHYLAARHLKTLLKNLRGIHIVAAVDFLIHRSYTLGSLLKSLSGHILADSLKQ